jgi:hypothetical protein
MPRPIFEGEGRAREIEHGENESEGEGEVLHDAGDAPYKLTLASLLSVRSLPKSNLCDGAQGEGVSPQREPARRANEGPRKISCDTKFTALP